MLSQLVYVSVRKEICTEEEIDKILDACKRNNHDDDITGVLLYSNTHFVQYLEGDYRKIMSLYDKIKEDNRHKNVIMISSGPTKERLFPSWQMGCKKFNDDVISFETDMSDVEQAEFQKILGGSESNNAVKLMHKFFKQKAA